MTARFVQTSFGAVPLTEGGMTAMDQALRGALDSARRREALVEAAQCLRCPTCRTHQIQLRAFDMAKAQWRCRICRTEWWTHG